MEGSVKGKMQGFSVLFRVIALASLCEICTCSEKSTANTDIEMIILVPMDTVLRLEPNVLDDVSAMYDFQLTDSAVFLLDHISRHVVRICLADGSHFLIGRSGQAPGELLNPVGFVVTDGIIRVTDAVQGMVCYDTSGNYIDSLSYFDNNLPLNLRRAKGQGFLGLRSINHFVNNDELVAQISVSLFETGNDAIVEYYSFAMPLDVEDIANSFYRAMTAVCYTADETSGNIYVALRGIDNMTIYGYNSSGEIIFSRDEQVEKIEMTQEEIESERLALQWSPIMARFSNNVDIEPYRLQIKSLGVDSVGNLWIETATAAWPSFVVLSQPEGDTLFMAEAPSLSALGSNYDCRMSSAGMIVRETTDDGSLDLYLMEIED
jgi:hypothetical protein